MFPPSQSAQLGSLPASFSLLPPTASTTPSYVKHSDSKALPPQPVPSPPQQHLNVSVTSTTSSIYRDTVAGRKANGNMSPPRKPRAGLAMSPSRETLKSNGTTTVKVKGEFSSLFFVSFSSNSDPDASHHSVHSPSKKIVNGAAASPRRRVVSKVTRVPIPPSNTLSPSRPHHTPPSGSVIAPPQRTTSVPSPVSPPRQHLRNLGPPGTESPRTKRRHSRVLVDVTLSGGNVQQENVVGEARKAGAKRGGEGKGERRDQLGESFESFAFRLSILEADHLLELESQPVKKIDPRNPLARGKQLRQRFEPRRSRRV